MKRVLGILGEIGSNLVLLSLVMPLLFVLLLVWLFGKEAEYLFNSDMRYYGD